MKSPNPKRRHPEQKCAESPGGLRSHAEERFALSRQVRHHWRFVPGSTGVNQPRRIPEDSALHCRVCFNLMLLLIYRKYGDSWLEAPLRSVAAVEHTLHYAHPPCLSSADQFTQNWEKKEGHMPPPPALSLSPSLLTRRLSHTCHELLVLRRLHVSSPHHTLRLKAVGVAPPACVIPPLRAARRPADAGPGDFSRQKGKEGRRKERNICRPQLAA